MEFAVLVDNRRKQKECEKKGKNKKVTIILIVIGGFGAETKGLLKGLEDLEVGGRETFWQLNCVLMLN